MSLFTPKGSLKQMEGSVLFPQSGRLSLIFVPVSNTGDYESTLYKQVTTKWSKVQYDHRSRFVNKDNFKLGELIVTAVSSDVWIVQGLMLNEKNKADKDASLACVKKLIALAQYEKAHIHVDESVLTEQKTLAKSLTKDVPEAGINLYSYSTKNSLVKR